MFESDDLQTLSPARFGMSIYPLNTFAAALAAICHEAPLTEKWLVAPSLRIGYQWLDRIALAGRPVFNVRVFTLTGLALDLAAAAMEEEGLAYASLSQSMVLVGGLLQDLKQDGPGYLSGLQLNESLIQAMLATIRDVRLSGRTGGNLPKNAFEVPQKSLELSRMISRYDEELRRRRLLDYAATLRLAAKILDRDGVSQFGGVMLLYPAGLQTGAVEDELLAAFPERNRREIPVDLPETLDGNSVTDARLLGRVLQPAAAPAAPGDGTASLFRAMGGSNEVREVIRRCLERRVPFDQVEILYTDRSIYVPLIYESLSALQPNPAATFAAGIPIRSFRPGRALRGWVDWVLEDYPQTTFVQMLQDGLFLLPQDGPEGWGFARLATLFRTIPIGATRSRYTRILEIAIQGAFQQLRRAEANSAAEEPDQGRHLRTYRRRHAGLLLLKKFIENILQMTPEMSAPAGAVLRSASEFLDGGIRCHSELDQYSRRRLLREIRELAASLEREPDLHGFNAWEWLRNLPDRLSVGGQGPRPGCLYVAPLEQGGHSGRRHTFVVGLDDSSFPGTGFQDPLLLDRERYGISLKLPTAAGKLERRLRSFAEMLAGLRGSITLSYACREITEDREVFPASVVLSAYRLLSGQSEGDYESLMKWLPPPFSFYRLSPGAFLNMSEWWMSRLAKIQRLAEPQALIAEQFPHLGRGLAARRMRCSDRFTPYDGYVPEAGSDLDPTRPSGPVLSASRLELLGKCPQEFFFQYVLRIEAPEEHPYDPSQWLDPLRRGTLLHDLFYEFMTHVVNEGRLPVMEDEPVLMNFLDRLILATVREIPPPSDRAFQQECELLRRTALIFLSEESLSCRKSSRPLYMEAAANMPPDGKQSPLDRETPVSIPLADGRKIRVRGRIDRIDRALRGGDHFLVLDYKSGSDYGYKATHPFQGGRRVQPTLYLHMAEELLKESVTPAARVVAFEYFFPGVKTHGRRLSYSSRELGSGLEVIRRLCDMLAEGIFPFTLDARDVKFSDYRRAFGDVIESQEWIRRKVKNPENTLLRPYRELRQ